MYRIKILYEGLIGLLCLFAIGLLIYIGYELYFISLELIEAFNTGFNGG